MRRFWIVAAALAAASCATPKTTYYRMDVSPELNYGSSYWLPPVEGTCATRARGELARVLHGAGYEVAIEGQAPEGAVTIRLEETACVSELFGEGKFQLGLVLLLAGPDGSEAMGERSGRGRRLHLSAQREDDGAILEFVAAPGGENLQDRMALLGAETDEETIEHEVSLRLLRHLASSVRHQQYHDTDVLTVHVKAPAPSGPQ